MELRELSEDEVREITMRVNRHFERAKVEAAIASDQMNRASEAQARINANRGVPIRQPLWTRDSALNFIQDLTYSVQKAGFHLALAGSVLILGESESDLDLILYPHTKPCPLEPLYRALESHGMLQVRSSADMQEHWREKGRDDTKHVEVWETSDGKRVDLFLLS